MHMYCNGASSIIFFLSLINLHSGVMHFNETSFSNKQQIPHMVCNLSSEIFYFMKHVLISVHTGKLHNGNIYFETTSRFFLALLRTMWAALCIIGVMSAPAACRPQMHCFQ